MQSIDSKMLYFKKSIKLYQFPAFISVHLLSVDTKFTSTSTFRIVNINTHRIDGFFIKYRKAPPDIGCGYIYIIKLSSATNFSPTPKPIDSVNLHANYLTRHAFFGFYVQTALYLQVHVLFTHTRIHMWVARQ